MPESARDSRKRCSRLRFLMKSTRFPSKQAKYIVRETAVTGTSGMAEGGEPSDALNSSSATGESLMALLEKCSISGGDITGTI